MGIKIKALFGAALAYAIMAGFALAAPILANGADEESLISALWKSIFNF